MKTKTPGTRLPEMAHKKQFVTEFLDVLTKMYGLTKQVETVVGNAFIRGVSGGERKRLSIAEQMATRSSVNMWDGSTRGLDASSALDYAKSLRVSTNLLKKATMVSIYQAVSFQFLFHCLWLSTQTKKKVRTDFDPLYSPKTFTIYSTRFFCCMMVAASTSDLQMRLASSSSTWGLSAQPARLLPTI